MRASKEQLITKRFKTLRKRGKTGIAAQGADRLSSEDRRQAHEAFSLLSLLTTAGELQPVFDVIENHRDVRAKHTAVRVLNSFATGDAVPKLPGRRRHARNA